MNTDFKFSDNYHNLPSTIAREQVHHHFAWLTPGSMKNHDWRGEGPDGAFKIGKKIIYPTDKLLQWLDSRIQGVARTKQKRAETKEKNSNAAQVHSSAVACKKRGRKRKDVEVRERRG